MPHTPNRTAAAALATATIITAPALFLAPTAGATEYITGYPTYSDCIRAENAYHQAHPGAYARCGSMPGQASGWELAYEPEPNRPAPTTWNEIGANFLHDFITGFFDS
ncbi:MAG: hypothetical protein EOP24_42265 [Hyphomicrobiales bacterium]|nr:MAG: hypothetical protein EOP24_42265 [Hyphomicrobiales bacterium]